ncbi:MAG: hypothetical protein HN348_17710 [Proteobacteria bacterium]|nr:hypothetical protein [Pseudomonadota bacterium]
MDTLEQISSFLVVLGYTRPTRRLLDEHDVVDRQVQQKASAMLDRGYGRLVSYESPEKGYEWFGENPGHEALTAYGLVEFIDMQDVYGGVDTQMIERTAAWLKSRRDGSGGYKQNSKALDSFGRASADVTNAYITWSLSEAQIGGIDKEIEHQSQIANTTTDPYLLALAANTLLNANHNGGPKAVERLMDMQGKDGSFPGADHSITRSGGEALVIEATALAILAMLKDNGHANETREAINWMNEHRGGYGQWGSTQSTILALRAMTAYAAASRKTTSSGTVGVMINRQQVGHFEYEAGHTGAIEFEGLGQYFRPGQNRLILTHSGTDALPYSIAVDYRSVLPATSPDVVVELKTELAKSTVPIGENVRLTAVLTNKTDKGQPMTLARIGLPGGLSSQTWQLEDLRESGKVGFYETGEREVVVYFRDLEPREVKTIHLDLVADIPGQYTAPASSAYLYYTNEDKFWVKGTSVTISR